MLGNYGLVNLCVAIHGSILLASRYLRAHATRRELKKARPQAQISHGVFGPEQSRHREDVDNFTAVSEDSYVKQTRSCWLFARLIFALL